LLTEIYILLKAHYIRLDPHAETWDLWIKGNKNRTETYEVAIGTILVQNTNWKNVNIAIANLKKAHIFSFKKLQDIDREKLEQFIRPAGFYTQKAAYLKSLSKLFLTYSHRNQPPSRQELLECKGIGKETADSILVYCFQHPIPIVGTYTRRFLARLHGKISYLTINYEIIQQELAKHLEDDFEVLGRFHALIVCHSQNICLKNSPKCSKCFLLDRCIYGQQHKTKPNIAQIQTVIAKPPKNRLKKT
jgi:endonuclease-3 related protein